MARTIKGAETKQARKADKYMRQLRKNMRKRS